MKGNGRWVVGAGFIVIVIIVFVIAQTVETVAVARGRFCAGVRIAGLGGVRWDGTC
jgi:hypothetical protein